MNPGSPRQAPSSDASLASERLRRAIERNRRKRLRKGPPPAAPGPQAGAAHRGEAPSRLVRRLAETGAFQPRGRPLPGRLQAPPGTAREAPLPTRARATAAPLPRAAAVPREPSPAPLARPATAPRWQKVLFRCAWLFHGYLLVRLAVSEGGAVDLYRKQEFLAARLRELDGTTYENALLEEEIERIRTNGSHQKKLVRDHLGFIGEDEYLVLFAGEGEPRAR